MNQFTYLYILKLSPAVLKLCVLNVTGFKNHKLKKLSKC